MNTVYDITHTFYLLRRCGRLFRLHKTRTKVTPAISTQLVKMISRQNPSVTNTSEATAKARATIFGKMSLVILC